MRWFFGFLTLIALVATIAFPFLAPFTTSGVLVGITAALGATTVGLGVATVAVVRQDQNQQRIINGLENRVADLQNDQAEKEQRQKQLTDNIRAAVVPAVSAALSAVPRGDNAPQLSITVNYTDNTGNIHMGEHNINHATVDVNTGVQKRMP